MHVGGATCAIPPTFGEVGVIVILKIVESVFFFLYVRMCTEQFKRMKV